MAHQQESFLPFSSRQSLSCCQSHVARRSTSKPPGPDSHPSRGVPLLRQSCMVLSLLPAKAVWFSFPSTAATPGFFPSANLPLQPHFRLLLQSVTPASFPVFFQFYWAAIVSLGRCSPMAWSQSSPSSHAGTVTWGSCFPVISWVEVTPTSLAQSMATAI